jgi:hypothetical protein
MNSFFKKYENGNRPLGSRLSTMKIGLSLVDRDKNNNFVETGTTRKTIYSHPNIEDRAADGCSTLLFADFVTNYGGHVWTCDIESINIENCKIATEEYKNIITYITDDSINFLQSFNQEIDFLYLDSLDGNDPNAHEHQLKEIKAAYDKLNHRSIIILDDMGSKTNLSSDFLKSNNWCQLLIHIPFPAKYNNFMQCLFVHEKNLYVDHNQIPLELRYKDI